jgi:hypothetical protein
MLVFATHTVLTEKDSPHGYLLLRCIRAYLEMIAYENLGVHTSLTIYAGRKAVTRFGNLFTVSFMLFTTDFTKYSYALSRHILKHLQVKIQISRRT